MVTPNGHPPAGKGPNLEVVLLSLIQVLQHGIKRHFKAATFGDHILNPELKECRIGVRLLGLNFEVTVQLLDSADEKEP